MSDWFAYFRSTLEHGQAHAVLLQETHVEHKLIQDLQLRHASGWGFPSLTSKPLSLWSSGGPRSAGVALLFNPYDDLTWHPALKQIWSDRFIAAHTTLNNGKRLLLCNIYCENTEPARAETLSKLLDAPTNEFDLVIVGGDWNCTLHDADRSIPTAGHYSRAVQDWLSSWGLVDALELLCPDEDDFANAARQLHSHGHLNGNGERTARLDRFYTSASVGNWIYDISTTGSFSTADHLGTLLSITDPDGCFIGKRPPRLFPTPGYAAMRTHAAIHELLAAFPITPSVTCLDLWEQIKLQIVREASNAKMISLQKMKNSHRQRIRRIQSALRDETRSPLDKRRLLTKLAQERLQWIHRKARQQRANWIFNGRESSSQLYQRISTQSPRRPIRYLDPTPGFPVRDPQNIADTMADGWAAVFNPPIDRPISLDWDRKTKDYLEGIRTLSNDDLAVLEGEISTEEVRETVLSLASNKSCGPDRLPNEFYKEYASDLIPILTLVLNHWWTTGKKLRTSLKATIVAIPKGPASSAPLSHRPIALLNTDYKILAKILATRLRRILPSVLLPSQHGFVCGRNIHEAIDIMMAILKGWSDAKDDTVENEGIVLLLDFAKAYDSLHRNFLYKTLTAMRFPSRFIRWIKATHSDTKAQFLVNGLLSRHIPVVRGIRQGCPLAPVLFILALETLVSKIQRDTNLTGLTLSGLIAPLTSVCYADDTALFLHDAGQTSLASECLNLFGDISGLQINLQKSIAIPLSGNPKIDTTPFPKLQKGELVRYLGIHIGLSDFIQTNWSRAIASLRTRLGMAITRNLTISQRAAIVQAVVVPKVTFVARHCFPPRRFRRALETMMANFVWDASLSHTVRGRRACFGPLLASNPRKFGGIGMPDLRTTLLQLSATTVWTSLTHSRTPGIAAQWYLMQLNDDQIIYPSTRDTARQILSKSLWDTGVQMVQHMLASILLPTERTESETLARLNNLEVACHVALRWTKTTLIIDASKITRYLKSIPPCWDPRWLNCCKLSVLYKWLDIPPKAKATMSAARFTKRFGDHFRLRWIRFGVVELQVRTQAQLSLKRAIGTLAIHLSAFAPEIFGFQDEPSRLIPIPATEDSLEWNWSMKNVDGEWHLSLSHWTQSPLYRAITSAVSFSKLTEIANIDPPFRPKQLAPCAGLIRVFWPLKRMALPSKKRIRQLAAAEFRSRCKSKLVSTLQSWNSDSPLSTNIPLIPWCRIQQAPLTSQDQHFWRRVRLRRLPTFSGDLPACGNSSCGTASDPYDHIFWWCKTATRLWQHSSRMWGRSGVAVTTWGSLFFSLTPPSNTSHLTSGLVLDHLRQSSRLSIWGSAQEVISQVWLINVTVVMLMLWRRRNRLVHHEETSPPDGMAFEYDAIFARRLCDLIEFYQRNEKNWTKAAMAKHIYKRFLNGTPDWIAITVYQTSPIHVLLFDGGSRGNPGRGGSGSAIAIAIPFQPPRIVWINATYHADSRTTNNFAEIIGALSGLRELAIRKVQRCVIIGDSAIVLHYFRSRTQPKNPKLRDVYTRSMQFVLDLPIEAWNHHLRAQNTLADHLANYAMDTQRSLSTNLAGFSPDDPRIAEERLTPMLHADLLPWLQKMEWEPP